MSFRVHTTEKRGVLDASFLVAWAPDPGADRIIECDPLDAKGGSLVDVITTGLLLVFLKSHTPRKRPILMLDEPGKYLDSEKRTRYGHWLTKISRDLGVQVIMITHDVELRQIADRLFQLSLDGRNAVQVKVEDAEASDFDGFEGGRA